MEPNFVYNLTIIASNTAEPLLYSETFVFVKTETPVYCKPQFLSRSPKYLEVPENFPLGMAVGQVYAVACQQEIVYKLADGNFKVGFGVDSIDGHIILMAPLDYEKVRYHFVTVNATTPNSFALLNINISVLDVNDNSPVITADTLHVKVSKREFNSS